MTFETSTTLTVTPFIRRNVAFLLAGLLLAGCDIAESAEERVWPSDPAPPPAEDHEAPPPAPAATKNDVCVAVTDHVEAFGAPSACDAAFATSCASAVGLFSDAYVAAVAACIDEDHAPMVCIVVALAELEPTAAQRDLAARYCDDCVLGVPGCEEAFYFGPDDAYGLGMIALPFSDELVTAIADECTDSFTCAADLPSCAKEPILSKLAPAGTLTCLLEAILPV